MSTAAVIGLGDISSLHLAAITANPGIDLVAVCDTDAARAAAAGARLGVPAFTDYTQLLGQARPDVVHITTPHDQHVPVALAALADGVHVLTEKPVAHTVAEADRLAAAVDGRSKVGVVLQNRYNPTAQAIRSALDDGLIGAVLGARAAVWWSRTPDYYAAGQWRGRWASAGGGVLINQAIHTLDLLLWYLGEAVTVCGTAATLALRGVVEVEDTAAIVIGHRGGVRSAFFATNTNQRNQDVELEVFGETGVLRLADGTAHLENSSGTVELASDAQATGERSYWGKGHELLIADFHARLAEADPFWIGLEAGLAPLRVLREVYRQAGLLPAGQPV